MIKYPIFLCCRDYTNDTFWIQIFENLSKGITPPGIRINGNEIYTVETKNKKVKRKEFNYKFNNDEPSQICKEIMRLFELSGVSIVYEKIKDCDDYYEFPENWSEVKKKSIKDILILEYISQKGKEYNLPENIMRNLLFVINSNIAFKVITSNDIKMRSGGIEHIDGLSFHEGGFTFNKSY